MNFELFSDSPAILNYSIKNYHKQRVGEGVKTKMPTLAVDGL